MLKKSLVVLGLVAGLVSISPAQDLQTAIQNIDVRGMLRYRYTDDRYKNQDYKKDNNGNGRVRHQYRAEINFKTAPVDNTSFQLGLLYHNPLQNVNHGKGLPDNNSSSPFLGRGLGSGKDSSIGVSNFNMTLTPSATATSVKLGKMVLNMPYNDVLHDRATGAMITNSDIQNWTFMASVFDSWSVDDMYLGYLGDNRSINKLFFSLAALGEHQTNYGNFHTQIWGFHIDDMLNAGLYTQLSWDNGIFFYNGFYSFADMDNSSTSILYTLYKKADEKTTLNPQTNKFKNKADLFGIELGTKLHQFKIPLRVRVGYWGNTQDSYTVSLDNEGYYMLEPIGRIFFESSATGMTISMLPNTGTQTPGRNESNSLNLFYVNPTYELTKKLKAGVEYVKGATKFKRRISNDSYNAQIKFQEITPILTYQHTKQMRITAYYIILNSKSDKEMILKKKDISTWNDNTLSQKERRNRFRLEVRYNF